MKNKNIKLTYGDGFGGRDYYMTVDDKHVQLAHGLGGDEEMEMAKQKALTILKERFPDESFEGLEFKHNGHL